MSLNRYKLEEILYLAIFSIGMALRLVNLGALPLGDGEAAWAVQALDLARRTPDLAPGAQAGYIALSGAAFSLLGATGFLARLFPALGGALLVLAPYHIRNRLGRTAALVLAALLAFDPVLVAGSRLAGSPLAAAGFGMLAWGLLAKRRWLAGGILAGLALTSGPGWVQAAIIAGLTWGLLWLMERAALLSQDMNDSGDADGDQLPGLRRAGLAALVTALAVSTLLGWFPRGLGALAGSIPAYMGGWLQAPLLPASHLVILLPVYQPLGLIFGLAGVVRAWREGRRDLQVLAAWLLAALLVVLAYPARQPSDLVWVLLPLLGLAAAGLANHLEDWDEPRWIAVLLAASIVILMALFGLNLASLGQVGWDAEGMGLRLGVVLGSLALQAVMVLLVGLGWDWPSARRGLAAGLCISLGLYSLAGMWGATQRSYLQRQELLAAPPSAGDADLLLDTLADLSAWQTGETRALEIASTVQNPSIRWALRQFPNARFLPDAQALSLADSPAVVITRQVDAQPALAASYRGQDFAWWVYPAWEGSLPPDPLRWLALRQAPLIPDQVIVWARGDIFPGGVFSAAPEQLAGPQVAPQDVDPEVEELP